MTGQLNDVSGVDKFEISREEYETRPGLCLAYSLRYLEFTCIRGVKFFLLLTLYAVSLPISGTVKAFKEANKMGRFAEAKQQSGITTPPHTQEKSIPLGSRCRLVDDTDAVERRGTVRFVGTTEFGKKDNSTWVGIQLDEPLGKNDGS